MLRTEVDSEVILIKMRLLHLWKSLRLPRNHLQM